MLITDEPRPPGYEQVVSFKDDDFYAIIAIHSTRLGPALGGCRIQPYLTPAAAMLDALRLSKAMTYKSSLAGLWFGGGKMVVMADRPTRETMLRVGEAVNYFNGRYITAEDFGTSLADITIASEVTPHVKRVDGSALTALGVLAAIKAAVQFRGEWGDSIDGVPIWVQGLGKVGMALVDTLVRLEHHTNVYVTDLIEERVTQACAAGAHRLNEADRKFAAIYVPCAMGQVVHAGNVHGLTHSIICGAANNQLADASLATTLHANDVLWCPDFLVNAGGVICAAHETADGYDQAGAEAMAEGLGECLRNVLEMAKEGKTTPLDIAEALAEARLV